MQRHEMGDMGTYLIFGRNGMQLGGMFNKGDMGKPGAAYWVCYVSVPNLDEAIEDVKAGRGSVLHGPSDVPGGDKIAQLMDPHGAFFAVHWSRECSRREGRSETCREEAARESSGQTRRQTRREAGRKTRRQAGAENGQEEDGKEGRQENREEGAEESSQEDREESRRETGEEGGEEEDGKAAAQSHEEGAGKRR